MGVTRPQALLRQPCPVSLPQPESTAGPEEGAETRGAWGAGSTVRGRGEPGSALLGLRHGPQTEAKPWKQDHIMRALVFDDCSLNKLENKCLTLSQSKHCPWSRSKPVHIRVGGSQATGAGWAAGHPDNSEGSVHTCRKEPQAQAGRSRVWPQGCGEWGAGASDPSTAAGCGDWAARLGLLSPILGEWGLGRLLSPSFIIGSTWAPPRRWRPQTLVSVTGSW